MSGKSLVVVIATIIAAFVVGNSVYIVNEYERAVELRFGRIENPDVSTGIHFKIPFMDTVHRFDGRLQALNAVADDVYVLKEKRDEKRGSSGDDVGDNDGTQVVEVDYFTKWRINDTKKYYESTGGDSAHAGRLLSQEVAAKLKNQFAVRTLHEVVFSERDQLMVDTIATAKSNVEQKFGIELIDIRVKRIDFPEQVVNSVFNRMKSDQEKQARAIRAHGEKRAAEIMAETDAEVVKIKAKAFNDAEVSRGEGDGEAAKIYAEAYNTDPEFYAFVRSLQAYKQSFASKGDILVIDPESDYFKYFKSATGSASAKP